MCILIFRLLEERKAISKIGQQLLKERNQLELNKLKNRNWNL